MSTIPFPVIHPSRSKYLGTTRPHISAQARTSEGQQVYLLVYKTPHDRWAKRSVTVAVDSHRLIGLGTPEAIARVKARIEAAIRIHGVQFDSRKLAEVIFYKGVNILAVKTVDINPKHLHPRHLHRGQTP